MAITITQEPTSPNVSYTKLMYVASGSGTTSNPQYKYVIDVFESGSSTRLARLKTPANPDGIGVFDVSSIIQDDLGYDENWYHPGAQTNASSSRLFQLKFGEEYATSDSGSVTVYDGQGGAGDPAVTSSVIMLFKGTLDPTIYNSYNFNQDPFDTSSMASDLDRGPRLSDSPFGYSTEQDAISLSNSDFHTISVLGQLDSGYRLFAASCSVEYIGLLAGQTSSFGFAQYGGQTPNDIITIGCGPNNFRSSSIAEVSSSFTESWGTYIVDVIYTGSGGQISSSYYFGNDEFDIGTFGIIGSGSITTWQQIASLPYDVLNHGGLGTGTSALSVAGRSNGIGSDINYSFRACYEYDGAAWLEIAAQYPLTIANGLKCSGVVGDGLGMGGQVNVNSPFYGSTSAVDDVYSFNGSTWSFLNNMNYERIFHGAAGTANDTLVVGGDPSGSINFSQKAEYYNGSTWSTITDALNQYTQADAMGNSGQSVAMTSGRFNSDHIYWNGTAWSTTTTDPFIPLVTGSGADGRYVGTGNATNSNIMVNASFAALGGNTAVYWNGITWNEAEYYPIAQPYVDIPPPTGEEEIGFGASAGTQAQGAIFFGGTGWGKPGDGLGLHVGFEFGITGGGNSSGVEQSPTSYPVCYPPTKFAFINNYGVWDYVQVIYPINKVTDLKRESVSLPNANYSDTTSIYDISKRGKTTYYTKPKSKYNITTGYLPQGEADWWPQLIESPDVYIQDNGTFVGIIVTNSSYKHKTNPRGQKVFQYKIEFEYANNDRARI